GGGCREGRPDEPVLQITRLMRLEEAERELARELHLLFKLDQHRPLDVDALGDILRKTPGACPVIVTVKDPGGRRCVLKLGRDMAVNPPTYHKDELEGV